MSVNIAQEFKYVSFSAVKSSGASRNESVRGAKKTGPQNLTYLTSGVGLVGQLMCRWKKESIVRRQVGEYGPRVSGRGHHHYPNSVLWPKRLSMLVFRM